MYIDDCSKIRMNRVARPRRRVLRLFRCYTDGLKVDFPFLWNNDIRIPNRNNRRVQKSVIVAAMSECGGCSYSETDFLREIAISQEKMLDMCFRHGLLRREKDCGRCGQPAPECEVASLPVCCSVAVSSGLGPPAGRTLPPSHFAAKEHPP